MKYLFLLSLTLFVSCGKDNKSGGTPGVVAFDPLTVTQHEYLVGRWANLNGCEPIRERQSDRNRRFDYRERFERFEIHFYPTDKSVQSSGYLSGRMSTDNVEYLGPCQSARPFSEELNLKRYIVVNDGIVIPSRSGRNRDDRKFEITILDQNRILYTHRNVQMELTRISNNPGF